MNSKRKSVLLLAIFLISTAAVAATQPVVVLIATGGTIAMKIDPIKKAPVPAISGKVSAVMTRSVQILGLSQGV